MRAREAEGRARTTRGEKHDGDGGAPGESGTERREPEPRWTGPTRRARNKGGSTFDLRTKADRLLCYKIRDLPFLLGLDVDVPLLHKQAEVPGPSQAVDCMAAWAGRLAAP